MIRIPKGDFRDNPFTILNEMGIWRVAPESLKVEKYIINDRATILFWNDGNKTISKRHEGDKFDKEIGYLLAYFYKKYAGSKSSKKRVIESIDYKKIKTFLLEFYVNDAYKGNYEKARKYLSNLTVEK